MPKLYVSTVIAAPIDKVWPHLRNFGALQSYESNITSCTLAGAPSGTEVGSVRSAVHRSGASVRETLIALSDVDHSGSYTVEAEGAPIANCVSYFRLRPVTDSGYCFIEWSSTFDVTAPGAEQSMLEFLEEEVYLDCFKGLKHLAASYASDSGRLGG